MPHRSQALPHRPPRRARHPLAHAVRWLAGWAFLFLGVLGLFLPVLQGILFLAVGFALLAPYVPLFRRARRSVYRRFPRIRTTVRGIKRRWRGTKKARR
jgi:uncharacterized membrane protein YbaN (DUF454 family)